MSVIRPFSLLKLSAGDEDKQKTPSLRRGFGFYVGGEIIARVDPKCPKGDLVLTASLRTNS
jgi:hypothetical protein